MSIKHPRTYHDTHGSRLTWVDDPASIGIRTITNYSSCPSSRHSGWYINEFLDEVLEGVALQIAGHNSAERWLAGYSEPWQDDAYIISVSDIWDCADDAAREGDRLAQAVAEEERLYNEQWQARSEYDDLQTDMNETKVAAHDVRRLLKKSETPSQTRTLRKHLSALAQQYLDACYRRSELFDNFSGTAGWTDR